MLIPYLDDPLATTFDHWLASVVGRYVPPLTYAELRKGVQALSMLYVERRDEGNVAARAIDGQGKRGAFATYYAALHFITVHHALEMMGGTDTVGTPRRIIDLGCGTGVVGAALATALPGSPAVLGVDRSGWALEEAERTWAAFGVSGRAVRAELPDGVPQIGEGDMIALGWSLSEWDDVTRAKFLRRLFKYLRKGVSLFIAEPLSTQVAPWWDEWAEQLASFGVSQELCKIAIVRPQWIQDMDKASRLDHQVVGARVMAGRTARRSHTRADRAERDEKG